MWLTNTFCLKFKCPSFAARSIVKRETACNDTEKRVATIFRDLVKETLSVRLLASLQQVSQNVCFVSAYVLQLVRWQKFVESGNEMFGPWMLEVIWSSKEEQVARKSMLKKLPSTKQCSKVNLFLYLFLTKSRNFSLLMFDLHFFL